MFFNKLTNTLALHGALLDLKAKSKVNTDFGSKEFQVEILNRVANNLVKEITASAVDSPMSKMSFATLAKEVNRDSALVEEILLQCYQQAGSKEEVVKAFFEADLLRRPKSA